MLRRPPLDIAACKRPSAHRKQDHREQQREHCPELAKQDGKLSEP